MYEIFVTVDRYQCFKSFQSNNIYQVCPGTLKIRFLVISNFLTIHSNCRLRSSAKQHSFVQHLIWNWINNDANIAAHLFIRPKVNSQLNLTGFPRAFLPVSGGSCFTC